MCCYVSPLRWSQWPADDISRKNKICCVLFQVIWCTLEFCVLAKWATAGCRMWTTAVSVHCAQLWKKLEICSRKRKERQEDRQKRLLMPFGEVSSSAQGVEWLFTEMQPTCFSAADAFDGSKTTPAVAESHWRAKSWGHTEKRGQRRERKKMREMKRNNFTEREWGGECRRDMEGD